jgi:maltooligosyltrehalose trehalohydrolase
MSLESEAEPGAVKDCYYLELDENLSGAHYRFFLNSTNSAIDPASRFQPDGVLGYSELVEPRAFKWTDDTWSGIEKALPLIYEIHVGTFTREGTFDALRKRLPYLVSLGVDAIELMPIAEFSGARNWGYDGVLPFAPTSRYGRPEELQRLIDEAHSLRLGVILDVVYNHLGPEGAPQQEFADYLSLRDATPWGAGLDFEERAVRDYVIDNALYWIEDFHFDGLRFDAIDRIVDKSHVHILAEVSETLRASASSNKRNILLIAEDAEHSSRCLRPIDKGGFGFDLIWNNHFHISSHAFVSGEREWFYREYGTFEDLVSVLKDGVLPKDSDLFSTKGHSELLNNDSASLVNFSQNHDVIGNRPDGARGSTIYGVPTARLLSGLLLFQASSSLLFMGEEMASDSPFFFFAEMSDPKLRKSISQGRNREMRAAKWGGVGPRPELEATFEKSILGSEDDGWGEVEFFRKLIACRSKLRDDGLLQRFSLTLSDEKRKLIVMTGEAESISAAAIFNFGDEAIELTLSECGMACDQSPREARVILDSLCPAIDFASVVLTASAPIIIPARSFKVVISG